MLAHGIIITKGKWVSLLRLRGDVRYQEDVREKEDRRWLPEATLAASRQEPTGIQAWFQAFDGGKKEISSNLQWGSGGRIQGWRNWDLEAKP